MTIPAGDPNPVLETPLGRAECDELLRQVGEAMSAQFEATNPGRLEQLLSVLDTASMSIEALFTETPYRLGA